MIDALFQKKPEYDENGRLVGYSQPKIVWIILALIVFYCCKDKFMKQKGGALAVGNLDTSGWDVDFISWFRPKKSRGMNKIQFLILLLSGFIVTLGIYSFIYHKDVLYFLRG